MHQGITRDLHEMIDKRILLFSPKSLADGPNEHCIYAWSMFVRLGSYVDGEAVCYDRVAPRMDAKKIFGG